MQAQTYLRSLDCKHHPLGVQLGTSWQSFEWPPCCSAHTIANLSPEKPAIHCKKGTLLWCRRYTSFSEPWHFGYTSPCSYGQTSSNPLSSWGCRRAYPGHVMMLGCSSTYRVMTVMTHQSHPIASCSRSFRLFGVLCRALCFRE